MIPGLGSRRIRAVGAPPSVVTPFYETNFSGSTVGTNNAAIEAIPNVFSWDGGPARIQNYDPADVALSTDPLPVGYDFMSVPENFLNFQYSITANDSWDEQRFALPAAIRSGTMAFEYDWLVPSNWNASSVTAGSNQHKIFALWRDSYTVTPGRVLVLLEAWREDAFETATKARLRVVGTGSSQNFSGTYGLYSNFINRDNSAVIRPGVRCQLRVLVSMSTSKFSNDGVFKVWIDGTLVWSLETMPLWSQEDPSPSAADMTWTNGYLMGYKNGAYLPTPSGNERVCFGITNFKAYNTDSGWV